MSHTGLDEQGAVLPQGSVLREDGIFTVGPSQRRCYLGDIYSHDQRLFPTRRRGAHAERQQDLTEQMIEGDKSEQSDIESEQSDIEWADECLLPVYDDPISDRYAPRALADTEIEEGEAEQTLIRDYNIDEVQWDPLLMDTATEWWHTAQPRSACGGARRLEIVMGLEREASRIIKDVHGLQPHGSHNVRKILMKLAVL